jgi:replicative DNA helicase
MSAAEKIPCVDAEAESRYLAACMHDDSVLERCPVWPREMGVRTNALVLEAMHASRAEGHGTDHVTISLRLEASGNLARIGGERALRAIGSVVELHPAPLARHIRTLAAARDVRDRAMRAIVLAESDLPEALRELRAAADARHPDEDADERYGTLKGAVESAFEELSARTRQLAGKTRPTYVTTGIRALDDKIGGWEYGDLIVFGGDTSVGKSTTALHTICEMARAGHRPGIISCEDPAARLGRRAISMLSGVPSVAIRKGDLSQFQYGQLSGAVARVGELEVQLAYAIGEPLNVVIECARMLIKERGCDVVLLDYAQAVRVPGMDERLAMREVLSQFKRECNRAAQASLGIVLSQFKRRADVTQRPARSDLYESGYLEQKADGIVLLWKDAGGVLCGVLDKAKDDETGVEFAFTRKGGVFSEVPL